MLSSDTSHLSKYLTTLGVGIVAATFSIAGLFLRLQDDLLVSRKELAGLTPSAQDTIRRRQEILEFSTCALPWFLAVGLLLGLCVAAIGLAGWMKRQDQQDKADQIDSDLKEFQLRQVTETERRRAAEEEARIQESDSEPPTDETGSAKPEHPASAALQAELDVLHLVRDALDRTHDVELGVEVRRDDARHLIDVLARPRATGFQYVFDVKYLRHLKTYRTTMRRAALQLAAAVETLGPDAIPCLVIAYGDSEPQQADRARALVDDLAADFLESLRVLVIAADDLQALDQQAFRSAFGIIEG